MDKEYLSPTKVCDIESVDLRMRSYILTKNTTDEKEKAINIFNFVRDEIKYRFDFPYTKASETLKKKYGNCFNKSTLQISKVYLIRKEVFKPIVPQDIHQLISDPTIHVSTVVYLDQKWVEADATIDYELYNAVYKKMGWEYEKWDGENDITINSDFIIEQY